MKNKFSCFIYDVLNGINVLTGKIHALPKTLWYAMHKLTNIVCWRMVCGGGGGVCCAEAISFSNIFKRIVKFSSIFSI